MQYCEDGYVCKLGKNVKEHIGEDIMGWDAESVADLCEEKGWQYSQRWHKM